MLRMAFCAALLACCGLLSGCCGGPCGPCGGNVGYVGHRGDGPAARFHRWRKSLACQAGCCETYWGEWSSYPPDCEDPCAFDYTVNHQVAACGGCGNCNECCFSPLPPRRPVIFGLISLIYGERYCEGCGEYAHAGHCDIDSGAPVGDWHASVPPTAGTGCSTCGDGYPSGFANQAGAGSTPRQAHAMPSAAYQTIPRNAMSNADNAARAAPRRR